MSELLIPTRAFAAFAWCTIATSRNNATPILSYVRLDYKPAAEEVPPTLTMFATDRYRVHRVIITLPADKQPSDEIGWSMLIPASVMVEAAKHPTVGKSRMSVLPLKVPDFGGRLEAGYDGWGATFTPTPGNFPPIERIIPAEPTDYKTGPIGLNMQYLGDLAKYNLGGRRGPDQYVWRLTWTPSDNPNKPGSVFAFRDDDGISAVAVIQPYLLLR